MGDHQQQGRQPACHCPHWLAFNLWNSAFADDSISNSLLNFRTNTPELHSLWGSKSFLCNSWGVGTEVGSPHGVPSPSFLREPDLAPLPLHSGTISPTPQHFIRRNSGKERWERVKGLKGKTNIPISVIRQVWEVESSSKETARNHSMSLSLLSPSPWTHPSQVRPCAS